MSEQKKTGILSIVFVAFFVAVGVLSLEPMRSVKQATTYWYAPLPGTVTRLIVENEEFASVEYTYVVNGRRYFGERFSHCRRLDKSEIEGAVGTLRPGAPVTVYTNVKRPDECVLVRGLTSRSKFGLLWSIGATLGLVASILQFVIRNRSKDVLKRQYADRVEYQSGIKRLRMIPGGFKSPAQVAVACLCVFSLLCYGLLEIGDRVVGWWHLSVEAKIGIAASIGIFGAAFDYFYTLRGNERGRWDLIVDDNKRLLQLPAIGAYGQPTAHQLKDIRRLEMKTLIRPDDCDNNEGMYRLNIICREDRAGDGLAIPFERVSAHAVAQSKNRTELDALSEWLNDALGMSLEMEEAASDGTISTLVSELHATSQSRGISMP